MKIIRNISHPECNITVFQWNGKYIIKFETPSLEQTYKVSELDLLSEKDLEAVLSGDFIRKVLSRFDEMGKDFREKIF